MEASPEENQQQSQVDKRTKILTGFLQYYHLAEWSLSVTFVRKGENLVFEFVKDVKKEGTDRCVLHTIVRKLAQKKPSVNWAELLLSTELRGSVAFVATEATEFTFAPLEVSLLVIVDPTTPLAAALPPVELWKKNEDFVIPEEAFNFPSVLIDESCETCKGVVGTTVQGKTEFFDKLHVESGTKWEPQYPTGQRGGNMLTPGTGGSKPFCLYTYEDVCYYVKNQHTLKPYIKAVEDRTDLTGAKLLLWADPNLPLAPPPKFESFVAQLRIVLRPQGFLQITPFEYLKTIGDEYNTNLESLNQELLTKFGISLQYIAQFFEARKEKKEGAKTKPSASKNAKHLDYVSVYQLPAPITKDGDKELRYKLDSVSQYELFFAVSDAEWKEKWTVKGVEYDSAKIDHFWKKDGVYSETLCHSLGKLEPIGSARRQFGESPIDTAIRKLNSDFYGYFTDKIAELKSTLSLDKAELFGGYLITFPLEPQELPDNLLEEIAKFQAANAGASDGDLLFSESPKFWAGPHGYVVSKFAEHDARVSVAPPSTQLNWLLVREKPLSFLPNTPSLFATALKIPIRVRPVLPGAPAPAAPAEDAEPSRIAKITNRPYTLTEEQLKTFFSPLTIETTKILGRTILVKFGSAEDLNKALNADGMFFPQSGIIRIEPSSEEEFNAERKPVAPSSPSRGRGGARGGVTRGGRGGRGGKSKGGQSRDGQMRIQRRELPTPTEGRWERPDKSPEEAEAFRRSVRNLLNKLTIEMYPKLSENLATMFSEVPSLEYLTIGIDLIYEKALSESHFRSMYAGLCKKLTLISPKFKDGEKEKDFRRVLIDRCRESFVNKQRPKKIDAEITNPAVLYDLMEQAKKLRDFNVGNVKFIGALFKYEVLTERVIHGCLADLLHSDDEEDIEDFCHLMKSIGLKIDTEEKAVIMDNYFRSMKELIASENVSPRIKFTLQNLIDLRKDQWIDKREAQGPMSIKKVHEKSRKESGQKIILRKQTTYEPILSKPSSSPTADSPIKKVNADDGWNIKGGKGKGKGTGVRMSTSPVSAVPGGFGRGQPVKRDNNHVHGQFGALGSPVSTPPGSPAIHRHVATEGRDGSPSRRGVSVEAKDAPLTAAQIEKKIKEIVDEFLDAQEIDDTIECFKKAKISEPKGIPGDLVFSKAFVTAVNRKKESDWELFGNLFGELLRLELISEADFKKGFDSVMETYCDLREDMPIVWKHFSFMLADGIERGYWKLEWMESPGVEDNIYTGDMEKIVATVLSSIAQREGLSTAIEIYKSSGIDLTKFMKDKSDAGKQKLEQAYGLDGIFA
eukprot:TRINITY_DN545_c0_g2_i3.p1 TRINITY_DN545_c0_g2~~TRINITY_DN545_c0_g2_i3.p1  ORF type:complete len:1305 (+),score=351.90 TRINITY_DN545_c0_g2_i3:1712-5626(+)